MKTLVAAVIFAQFLVQDLIEGHIRAAGGSQVHQKILSIHRSGTIYINESRRSYSYDTKIVYPNKLREELSTASEILVSRGTNGVDFWEWKNGSYKNVSDPGVRSFMKETAERANRDILWVHEEINHLEKSEAPGWIQNADCISGIKNEEKIYLCFDRISGFLIGKGNQKEYRTFSDWQQVQGLAIPFTLTHYMGGSQVYQIELSRVSIDASIDERVFNKP